MIVVLAAGRSFQGALAYYRHDKQSAADAAKGLPKPTTSKRVGFVETRNLAHDDIDGSLAEMLGTVHAAPLLKQKAGLRHGRPLQKPVQTVSLSWHPSERLERTAKQTAAEAFLAAMGWQEHQAIIIEHTDTAHPHLHIVLSRVHPETGRSLDNGNDRHRAQRWAEAYERKTGQTFCPARESRKQHREASPKSAAPRQRSSVPRQYDDLVRRTLAEFTVTEVELEAYLHAAPNPLGPLHERHAQEREAFMAAGAAYERALRYTVWQGLENDARAEWRGHYRYARVVKARAEAAAAAEGRRAAAAQTEARDRRSRGPRMKALARAAGHLEAEAQINAAATAAISDDRRALVTEIRRTLRARLRDASATFTNQRYAAADALLTRQEDERAELGTLTASDGVNSKGQARLAQLLHAPPTAQGDQAERIDQLLQQIVQDEARLRSKANSTGSFGMVWRRRTDRAMVAELDRLTTQLRRLTDLTDQGAVLDRALARRLAALTDELDAAAERGARQAAKTWSRAETSHHRLAETRAANRRRFMRDGRTALSWGGENDPEQRIAFALAATFDTNDVFASLSAALIAEHGAVLESSHAIMAQPALQDADLPELRRQILMADHLARLAWRAARLDEIIAGGFVDASRGHSRRTAFLDWTPTVVDYGPMQPRASIDARARHSLAIHDAARADAATLRHGLAARLRQPQSSLRAAALSNIAETAIAQSQLSAQHLVSNAEAYLADKEREIDRVARYGTASVQEIRQRKRAFRRKRHTSEALSAGYRLTDYEMTRRWRRGEWRMVRRPPPVTVLHARRIRHSSTDCPFCRLDWGRCPTHPRS